YLPMAHVTDLDLAVGNINPTNGKPDQSTGFNLLVATTYGRGTFAIRLPNNSPFNRFSGPVVKSLVPTTPGTAVSSVMLILVGAVWRSRMATTASTTPSSPRFPPPSSG